MSSPRREGPGHVVVTGASGGIGGAVCALLASREWRVTGIDRQAPEVEGSWQVFLGDLAEPGAAGDLARRASREAPVTAVVHAAAVQVLGGIGSVTPAQWATTLQVNVLALDEMVRECLETLREARGSVVAISSVHARATTRGIGAYSTSKAALEGWVRAAALDLAPAVRVNTVQPGAVMTPMLRDGLARRGGPEEEGRLLASLAASTPLGVVGSGSDIAEAVAFLLDGNRSGFMTGTVLRTDGGALLGLATE